MTQQKHYEEIKNGILDDFKSLLSKINQEKTTQCYRPKWKSVFLNNKYVSCKKTNRIRFEKIISDNNVDKQTEFTNLVSFFSKYELINNQQIDVVILTRELLCTYLHLGQSISFNQDVFNKTIELLSELLVENRYHKREYFSPLYGLDCDQDRIVINQIFSIERISNDKFDRISDLDLSTEENEPIPNYVFKQIKFVLRCSFPQNHKFATNPQPLSYKILSALRLTNSGFVSLGEFYPYESTGWFKIQRPRLGPLEIPPSYSIGFSLERNFIEELTKIFNLLVMLDDAPPDKIRYLKYALRRFEYVYASKSMDDKITDLIISIETLLNKDPGEVSLSISLRAAMLLGQTEEEKEYVKKFFKKSYNIRSEIVHGKKREEKIKKNEHVLTDDEIESELDTFVRIAIKKMIRLQTNLPDQQKILQTLDEIVVNRNKESEITKFFN
jgi:hypothetical protein